LRPEAQALSEKSADPGVATRRARPQKSRLLRPEAQALSEKSAARRLFSN
jgi:hypothetical protein